MPPHTKPQKAKKLEERRRRHKITDKQRAALRERYAVQKAAGAAIDHKSMARWFEDTFQFAIDQSQVSRYLSSRYEHLDISVIRPESSKNRASKWPVLGQALFVWEQKAQN